jgi:NADH-quinone oxidoreductase subunit C
MMSEEKKSENKIEKAEKRKEEKKDEIEEERLTIEDIAPAFPLIYRIAESGVESIYIQKCNKIWVEVKRENLLEFCSFLKENGFDHLSCILGVDRGEHFEVIYHIWSYIDRRMLSVRVKVPKDDPEVDSVVSIWRAADWHERETYDMFGIIFRGHPDLRRILLPDDFEGFPLRKDFKLEERSWL